MKLGTLIQAREALAFAYRLKLKDGLRAFKLRKELTALEAELKTFDAIRDDAIKATGKTEITPKDKEFTEIMETLNQAAGADIADPTPHIEESDLAGVEASAAEIDAIMALGLFKEATTAEPPAMPGPAIAK